MIGDDGVDDGDGVSGRVDKPVLRVTTSQHDLVVIGDGDGDGGDRSPRFNAK